MTRRLLQLALVATFLVAPVGLSAAAPQASRRTHVVEAVEKIRPAVVNISAEELIVVRPDPFFQDFFGRFSQPRHRQYKRTSLGSGVLVRADGYVVTNAHVVARGDRITVTLADEREFEATLVGTDEHADLAVLRIEGTDLPHAMFGPSHDLMIGESVIAIGNPFGFSHTVTTGVISATGRSLRLEERTYFDFIQTDASINPGNSGGPLLNIHGELIGINTAIWGRAENIGFAIPAARASRAVQELIDHGYVRVGHTGVLVQDLTPALAAALETKATRGVVVRNVDPGSPAESAGLEVGDIVASLDGQTIRDRVEFDERLASAGVGTPMELEVHRADERVAVTIIAAALSEERIDDIGWHRLGLRVDEGATKEAVAITEVRRRSHAARAGIEPGDLLLAMEQKPIVTVATYRRAVARLRGIGPISIIVRRGNATYRVTLPAEG
ncbi:MAG: trypsin-like peptidase domain-containing protein [Candidatus Binatia bacterium]|nr:trypsin-like peptidase domain-containing protein [Candidatus Binatia bacterium]